MTFNPVFLKSLMLQNILNYLGNELMLPIIITIAIGSGILFIGIAVIDTVKHMSSGGRNQQGESKAMIIAKFLVGGCLISTGMYGGFNFIKQSQAIITQAAADAAFGGSGGEVPWDGLPEDNKTSVTTEKLADIEDFEEDNKSDYSKSETTTSRGG